MKRQIKTKLSRILCTALALCMIAALIPSAFATTTEETKTFTIDFLNDVSGTNTAAYPWNTEYDGTNVWASHSLYLNGALVTTTPNKNQLRYSSIYGMGLRAALDGDYYAVKFKAPESGNYKITYNHYQAKSSTGNPNGGVGDVYLLGEDASLSAAISDGTNKLFEGIIYGVTTSNTSATAAQKPEYMLEKDKEYIIAFVSTGLVEGGTSYHMYPTSLTFEWIEPTYSDIEAVYSFSTIGKDETNGYNSDVVTTPNMIAYENSGGRVEFDTIKTSADTGMYGWQTEVSYFKLNKIDEYVAFKIRVPKAGTYYATLEYLIRSNSATADMYIIQSTGKIDTLLDESEPVISGIDFWDGEKNDIGTTGDVFTATAAGEYYLIFKHVNSANTSDMGYVRPAKLTLSGSKDLTTTNGYPVAGINIEKTLFEESETATIEITANDSATGTVLTPDVENLESSDDKVISISGNTVTAEGPGVATITADVNGYPASVTLTVNDAALTEAFSGVSTTEDYADIGNKTVQILTYSTDGTKQSYEDTVTVKYNGKTEITAPDLGEDYTFLYWAKGATDSKQIIPGETVEIYPTVEPTYMIAVYAPTGATAEDKVEFYNYNGQLLDVTIEGGKMPALPSMTGYGKATHWALYGSTDTYKGGDVAPETSGTAIFVAQYKDLEENITVTAENCTVNDGSSATVKYGDKVECVADG
ncbi:MAG: hypothetical protein IJP38_05500 [Oscillospiraceae bacterium]|nr:hypothetical protein [Oscillospiraceae bacterium]